MFDEFSAIAKIAAKFFRLGGYLYLNQIWI